MESMKLGEASIENFQPDIIVVGVGVVGAALCYSLGNLGYKVLGLERDLKEPDRIVGELLQAGGLLHLKDLGMGDTVDGIDAIDVEGYTVVLDNEPTKMTYPLHQGKKVIGKSFHHGKFIQNLRKAAGSVNSVRLVQGTVQKLLYDEVGVCGVVYKSGDEVKEARAPFTFVCDGCFSNFRKPMNTGMPAPMSNFVGVIIHNCSLPNPKYGHVFLAKTGPILGYQIGTNDIRILVDVPSPLPSAGNGDLSRYLLEVTAPQLPSDMRVRFIDAINEGNIRSMTNSILHPKPENAIQPGCLMLGDAWNMRHPLTGGGMTVCFSDVKVIRDIFKSDNLGAKLQDRPLVRSILAEKYVVNRKPAATTINILAAALYGVFSAADDPMLPAMREACFAYFKLGGKAQSGPMSLLSGLVQSPTVLVTHFFAVAVFGCLRTILPFPTPYRILSAWRLLAAAAWIVIPLLKGEKVLTPFASFLSWIFAAYSKAPKPNPNVS